MTNTRSLALVAAVLLAGCATTNYYGDQSGNAAYDNNAAYNDQYSNQPYDQYADQPADVDAGVSFGSFQRDLTPYGTWSYNPRWGDVWRPRAAAGFRPYFNGYWANTREYGTMWVSDDPWDVTYHYGRWVFDPRDGWLWVPGYVWGPSWVVWRSGGGSIGWFPMPPDNYYGNGAYSGNYASFYGYRDWYGPSFGNDSFFSLWVFVGEDHFADRNYRNFVRPQREYNTIIVNTTEVTNYVTVNNYVVNRSVNVERIERASNRRFEPVEARTVMKREAKVTPVAAGRQIEQRERRERPIPANANANAGRDGNDGRADAMRAREDARDARQDARQDARDARQDARQDNAPNLRVRQNEMPDRNGRGPQNAQGPQGGGNQVDRAERREERIENRERVQAPQNANVPQQNGNVERRGPRDNAQAERAAVRTERAAERGGNDRPAVQPAGARQNEAAPAPAGGGTAAREKTREEERNARREEAAERRRNADR